MFQNTPQSRSEGRGFSPKRLAIYTCIVLCILVAFASLLLYPFWKQPTPLTLNDIRNDTGINFPKTSTLANQTVPARIIDPLWAAKVVVPHQSGKGLIQNLNKRADTDTRHTPSLAGTVNWWNPKKIVFEKLYYPNTDHIVYVVVAEERDGYAFYIEWAYAF